MLTIAEQHLTVPGAAPHPALPVSRPGVLLGDWLGIGWLVVSNCVPLYCFSFLCFLSLFIIFLFITILPLLSLYFNYYTHFYPSISLPQTLGVLNKWPCGPQLLAGVRSGQAADKLFQWLTTFTFKNQMFKSVCLKLNSPRALNI